MRIIAFAFVAILLAVTGARAQERASADVQVRSVSVVEGSGRLTCKAEIFSFNDDSARNTTVRILLPIGVRFISSTTGCLGNRSETSDGTQAVANCNLGTLEVGASRIVQVVTTVPPRALTGVTKTFGVFAWSLTPDPRPANNYKDGTAP